MKKSFTMLELIFVIIIIGIIGALALPKYFGMHKSSHETNLIAFVKTLNRTTGEDLWARSINENKNGSIKNLENNENALFLEKYITLPPEINKTSINLSSCGDNSYSTVMIANTNVTGEEYNITCKDGTARNAPYFRLIRIRDNKVLVSRD